jgi:(1->4)-alpha-D-glucan 1-alpha-D-glucosylmutase
MKMTCPGVPDFYQGSEFWELNMVDPDNRRPVNYQIRQKALTEILLLKPEKAPSLFESFGDAKAKLYLIYKTLAFRRKTKPLFDEGAYVPLTVKGAHKDCVVAFMRKKNDLSIIVVVPRFLTRVIAPESTWECADWADTILVIPSSEPSNFTNLLTGKKVNSQIGRLFIKEILGDFPVALLFGANRV